VPPDVTSGTETGVAVTRPVEASSSFSVLPGGSGSRRAGTATGGYGSFPVFFVGSLLGPPSRVMARPVSVTSVLVTRRPSG
jgi:hypothetical protein